MSDSFTHFTIHKNSTLKEALLQMTSTHRGVLLVTDSDTMLVGVIADGDVRRALLDDVSLNIPVTQVMNLNPVTADNPEEAKNTLESNPYYIVVPVINSDGVLVGVHSALNGNNYYKSPEFSSVEAGESATEPQKIKYLALIPARGGSKRIPGKNLSKIGKHTLVSLAIKAAKESKKIDHIIVSTDDPDIAAEAQKNGVDVPWMRPDWLADDSAKTVDVMVHALDAATDANGHRPGHIILLEPTAPLRTGELIDKAVEQFESHADADSLVSVNKLRHIYHPEEILKEDNGFLKPYLEGRTFDSRSLRDEQEELFIQNGLVYITRSDVLSEQKSIYGANVLKFETSDSLFADIDEPEDLELARLRYKNLFE